MAVLVCRCLNWSVHCQGPSPQDCDLKHLDLSQEEQADSFFTSGVTQVKLGLGGISQKHSFLGRERRIGHWTVHSCDGCKQDVYAEASDKMLFSSSLECGQEKLDALRASGNFSPCFKILLSQTGSADASTQGVSGARLQVEDPRLDSNLKLVHETAARFLRQEAEAMEARVRHFQEQQAHSLDQLKARTALDKDALCELLVQTSRHQLSDTLAEALNEEVTHGFSSVPNDATAVANNRSANRRVPDFGRDTGGMAIKATGRRTTPSRRLGRTETGRRMSLDTSQMFHLDGFEEDDSSAPFPPASSEDEADTDDSSMADECQQTSQLHCAYSLPVDMPAWRTPRDSRADFDDIEFVRSVDHEKIGANIEALARSVCDDTEMFGDLPRPRLNAGDLKTRPL